jgi:hypothetical protein
MFPRRDSHNDWKKSWKMYHFNISKVLIFLLQKGLAYVGSKQQISTITSRQKVQHKTIHEKWACMEHVGK